MHVQIFTCSSRGCSIVGFDSAVDPDSHPIGYSCARFQANNKSCAFAHMTPNQTFFDPQEIAIQAETCPFWSISTEVSWTVADDDMSNYKGRNLIWSISIKATRMHSLQPNICT
jgi:hypothetical protein